MKYVNHMEKLILQLYNAIVRNKHIHISYGVYIQESIWVWAQPMKDDITL